MSFWSEVREGLRRVLIMQHRVDLLSTRVEETAREVEDQNRRLIRIETIIELARDARLSRD